MVFRFALQIALILIVCAPLSIFAGQVFVGIDMLMREGQLEKLKNRHIGLVTNQTAVNAQLQTTLAILKKNSKDYVLKAIFAPEHGFYGRDHAAQSVDNDLDPDGIPIYSLHGQTRRPTQAMLNGIDLIIYDIQDIGSRSYTYITTLFYVMEEAAKRSIPVMVLDRPNPINGITIDGPILESPLRSMVGYVNVPYCYGMTVGELAKYFNDEYKIGCQLDVIAMKGWTRGMTFRDTGLPWIPTSPQIPESDTPLYYPITGILGEIGVVNIGVGYTLPFKLVGAPWIDAVDFAKTLNDQRYPGVLFTPFFWKPFYGKYKGENCQGVLICVTNPLKYKPLAIQFLLISTLKKLYPANFLEQVKSASGRKEMFTKVIGVSRAWDLLSDKRNFSTEMRNIQEKEKRDFYEKRKRFLIPAYSGGPAPREIGTPAPAPSAKR